MGERETWGHWCYDQNPVTLPVSAPRCPQCGALDLAAAPTPVRPVRDAGDEEVTG